MPFLDAIPVFGPWRIKRDAKKYDKWCAFIQTRSFSAEIFQIVGIRQQAQTGLKAYGRWLDSGQTCALWIEGAWPSIGVFMSAPGSCGIGPHHREEVFYARQPYYFVDQSYYAAMQRHISRANKAAAASAGTA
jgi:hypothetical protein